MKINILGKKGQNTAEYAILIALVIAAAVAMQTYVKRGMQGRVHDASDSFYDKFTQDANWANITTTKADILGYKQYEPEELSSQSTQKALAGSYDKTTLETGGKVTNEFVQKTQQADTTDTTGADYQKYGY